MIRVKNIVEQWLKEHNYDGLYSHDCGCRINDLMPCGSCGVERCEPGYEHSDGTIRPGKEEAKSWPPSH